MKKFTGAATISCAVIALALTACAPQSNENGAASADDAKETPITVAWSADSECGTCHATEQASYDDAACVASTHEGQACISCHADASGLATAHEGKTASDTMPKKLKKTEVPDDACLSCHYGAREELVAATVDVAVVDSKGTAVNPHDVTPSEQHDTIRCREACRQSRCGMRKLPSRRRVRVLHVPRLTRPLRGRPRRGHACNKLRIPPLFLLWNLGRNPRARTAVRYHDAHGNH